MIYNRLILLLILSITGFNTLLYCGQPALAAPGSEAVPSMVNITGVIFPNETDAEGNPLSIYIEVLGKNESEKNIEYFIFNDAKGKELLRLLYNNVNVIGVLSTNPMGNQMLTVQKYSIIESKPADLEDEY